MKRRMAPMLLKQPIMSLKKNLLDLHHVHILRRELDTVHREPEPTTLQVI
jgi:hypothetical protein